MDEDKKGFWEDGGFGKIYISLFIVFILYLAIGSKMDEYRDKKEEREAKIISEEVEEALKLKSNSGGGDPRNFDDSKLDVMDERRYEEEYEKYLHNQSNCSCGANLLDCADFSSQQEAQNYYNCCKQKTGLDTHWLDDDKDGIACEWL